jgi:(1->4)-alpha-D-glucan 1-alpha-D-glucosylmutase
VPDLYQGGELWDLSLVDPDNRRPVDYKQRAELLGQIGDLEAADVMARMDEGLPKLLVIHKALALRNKHPDWFGAQTPYLPVKARGKHADRVIAFGRGQHVIAVAPRWSHGASGWEDTSVTVPPGAWRNCMTGCAVQGGKISLQTLLSGFPVALLVREDGAA